MVSSGGGVGLVFGVMRWVMIRGGLWAMGCVRTCIVSGISCTIRTKTIRRSFVSRFLSTR